MRKVAVEITEILQKKIYVMVPEGASPEEALRKVEEDYGNRDLKLSIKDFVDVSFGIVN
ncbi:MAG: DpnD/PcfM family protein [Clostridiaceae bacterium]